MEPGGKRGLRAARLVGREEPWRSLEAALQRAARFQAPQFVTVIGSLGIGKSRLVSEWVAAVEGRKELRVLSLPVAPEPEPFALAAELLRRRFGIDERVDAEGAL